MTSSSLKSDIYAAVEILNPALLKLEPELIGPKWPPYRSLSPIAANKKFAEIFGEIWRERYTAEHVVGIDPDLFKPGQPARAGRLRERTSIHRARQRADRSGLDYRSFIEFANKFALDRKVKRLPRPNQLLSKKYSVAFGHKLAAFIKEHKPVEVPGDTISKVPGCIGHPGAFNRHAAVCVACPYLSNCAKACRAVAANFKKLDADKDNPKSYAARGRAKNRECVRDWRKANSKISGAAKRIKTKSEISLKAEEPWTI